MMQLSALFLCTMLFLSFPAWSKELSKVKLGDGRTLKLIAKVPGDQDDLYYAVFDKNNKLVFEESVGVASRKNEPVTKLIWLGASGTPSVQFVRVRFDPWSGELGKPSELARDVVLAIEGRSIEQGPEFLSPNPSYSEGHHEYDFDLSQFRAKKIVRLLVRADDEDLVKPYPRLIFVRRTSLGSPMVVKDTATWNGRVWETKSHFDLKDLN